ncbi:MAG: hypothetical protein Q8M15_08795 [Bacteroidota bacterium]|nr:hypothetical protein [Bacteroidota bacterium]
MYITIVEIENRGIIIGQFASSQEAILQSDSLVKKTEPNGLEHDFEAILKDFPEARCYEIMGNLFYPDGMSIISDGVCSIIVVDLKDTVNSVDLFIRGRQNTSLNLEDDGFETLFEKYKMESIICAN